ncbi:CPBP family intramembrane glutamic endopeptidase [Lacinutrix sp. Bg11-31]|uniref:CPBP family intramembrane glutamic endopeptidase n=1 Tax=Lacinutrix sp. Bg11-31 TaxID=2057808 RepID=UPI000C2FF4BB|nr:CPBP family intramembrane glutamic endopeptidase [Lacinutrix sp. Bg11-31]AUC81954.1 CPBP family intramembrane metalloprotease [Lacinutrix sp. Bg11-31]
MQTTLNELVNYIKEPNCETLQISVLEKLKALSKLLLIAFGTSFTLGVLISILAQFGFIEMDSHAISKLLNEKPKTVIFLMAVIAAPIFEELFFRAPLTLFCNKKYFKYIYYGFALLFGIIHITNYEISTTILIISPILISPQITLGLILGYTRIKLGFIYAILFHMLFNGILIVPSLLFMDI